MGLDRQIGLFALPPKNLIGALLLIVLYLFAFLILHVRSLRGFALLFTGIFWGLIFSSGLLLLYLDYRQADDKIAIVGETGGALRKVPDSDADEWLVLAKGTSVHPSVKSEGFYLVETSFGIKGWIDRNRIYFEDEP